MSGNQSLTAKERMEARDKLLLDYANNLGVTDLKQDLVDLYKQALHIQLDDLKGRNTEEIQEAAICLTQLSIHVQFQCNKEVARISWADAEIEKIIIPEMQQYGDKYTKYEEKKMLAINGNSSAKALYEIKTYAKARADYLNMISFGINKLSGQIEKYAEHRSRNHAH